VLYQSQNEGKRVIAYGSKSLTKGQKNYPAHKLEFLALKWAVCDKFHEYLYGRHFVVFTDNNPLTYVLTSAKLDATGHRWLAALSTYDFSINYRPGVSNADADGLSRMPREERHETSNYSAITREVIAEISRGLKQASPMMISQLSVEEDTSDIDDTVTQMVDLIYEQSQDQNDIALVLFRY